MLFAFITSHGTYSSSPVLIRIFPVIWSEGPLVAHSADPPKSHLSPESAHAFASPVARVITEVVAVTEDSPSPFVLVAIDRYAEVKSGVLDAIERSPRGAVVPMPTFVPVKINAELFVYVEPFQ